MNNSSVSCGVDRFSSVSLTFANEGLVAPSMTSLPQNAVAGSMVGLDCALQSFDSAGLALAAPSFSCHVCRVCSKTFRASSLLDIHMRVHVGAKPFVCPVCGHRATQKGNLKLHMKKHHGADLPPHIDLVPDSGIWGHPQESMSLTQQVLEGIVDNVDASGKRKQVAQAVSSLLNEEVVELIKKYQNEAGQATAGTITESLEDFIRIAKNKETSNAKMAAANEKPEAGYEKCDQRRQKHLSFSLRFQPYLRANEDFSKAQTFQASTVAQEKENSAHYCNCILCGRSFPARKGLSKLHVPGFDDTVLFSSCADCAIIHGCVRQLPSYVSMKENGLLGRDTQNSLAAVNNAQKGEVTGLKKCGEHPKKCEFCFAILKNFTSPETHKGHCHAAKNKLSIKLQSNEIPSLFDLTAESSAPTRGKNPFVTPTVKLNTVVMTTANIARSKSFPDLTRKSGGQLKSATKGEKVRKRPRSSDLELTSHEKRMKASPNVLTMLRRTLLNGSRNVITSPPSQILHSNSTTARNSKENKNEREALCYRNSTWQSHAQIRQSIPVFQNTRVVLKPSGYRNPGIVDPRERADSGHQCRYCSKWFRYSSMLQIHLRSHTGERPYKCPYCEYAGTQHNCLKLHIRRHHQRKYVADPSESAGLLRMYRSHLPMADRTASKTHHPFPVNCPICGRASPSPGYLKIHMRSHKKSLDHVCHVCGRGFKEYWYLSTHLKTHARELNNLVKVSAEKRKVYSTVCKPPKPASALDYSREKILSNSFVDSGASFAGSFSPYSRDNLKGSNEFRILKCEPVENRRTREEEPEVIYQSLSSQSDLGNPIVKTGVKADPDVREVYPSYLKSILSRSRRRKLICPSRVMSTSLSIPKPPIWHSIPDTVVFSDKKSLKRSITMHGKATENISDDLPLDLRCDAKKMSDLKTSSYCASISFCKT